MDADWSHDPKALPSLIAPIVARQGRPRDRVALHEGRRRRGLGDRPARSSPAAARCSRGSSCASSRTTSPAGSRRGAATTLASVPFDGVRAGGYVFQIEMTYRASRLGARVVEVPITFRDRRVGQSKMSRRIVVEALVVVVSLRWDELRGRGPIAAQVVTAEHRDGWRPGADRRAGRGTARRARGDGPAAAAGPGASSADRGLPRRPAGRPRRRSQGGRVVFDPARGRPPGPDLPLARPRPRRRPGCSRPPGSCARAP